MEYLLDTANLEKIENYLQYFPVSGITSNPSIVKREGKVDFFKHMKKIRSLIGKKRSLHIQVTAEDYAGMMKDADTILQKVDPAVFIKVPVTLDGIRVIKELKQKNIHVTATAIYTKSQGMIAMEAGADYLAPYYNRIENSGANPEEVIAAFVKMINTYGYRTKVVAASFKNAGQIERAFLAGAQAATFDPDIMKIALTQPEILKAVKDFSADWESVYGKRKLAELK